MNDFKQKIAVITGAATGIGRALALKAACEAMRVVIADINAITLAAVAEEIMQQGAEVIAVPTDVTKEADIKNLLDITLNKWGVPHLLFNNAGIGGTAEPLWSMPIERMQWVLNINLLGIMRCIHEFIPVMLERGDDGHIINTASVAGFLTSPYFANYQVSKHGVVALSECLYHDLKLQKSRINVSVLCPGWVKTDILASMHNYPAQKNNGIELSEFAEAGKEWLLQFARKVKKGINPVEVAAIAFAGIRNNQFYIHTHEEFTSSIIARLQAIIENGGPVTLPVQ